MLKNVNHLKSDDPGLAFHHFCVAVRKIDNQRRLNAVLRLCKQADGEPFGPVALTRTKIAILGNATLKPLCDAVKVNLLAHRIDADIWEAPFDQWSPLMHDAGSELYRFAPSIAVLYLSSLGITKLATEAPLYILDQLESAVEKFLHFSGATVLLCLPEALEEEQHTPNAMTRWRHHFIGELYRRIEPFDKVLIVDVDRAVHGTGCPRWHAPRYWYAAKMPAHPGALICWGRQLAHTLARCISVPVKVVACDLDNTLWGGIVGEDGWEHLHLDMHGLGGPYIRLQGLLKALIDKGVLLIAVSKNNEPDVREVFRMREKEMLLKWDDFTMVLANWKPKSENLKYAAKVLNLGLGNFCFLDDSVFERNEVRHSLPEVIVPELSANPEDYVPQLVRSGLFHIPLVTSEDKMRAAFLPETRPAGFERRMRPAISMNICLD